MEVSIVGEDAVTKEIARRLLVEFASQLKPGNEFPIRGGEIQAKFQQFRKLAEKRPVLLITDLDTYNCPVEMRNQWLEGMTVPDYFMFRICVDEAEGWLMADRLGLADYLKISAGLMPEPKILDSRNPTNIEIRTPYKPSLFLMKELAGNSSDLEVKRKLTPKHLAKKGPEYNSMLLPFIQHHWNVQTASQNSYSLRKAIGHIQRMDALFQANS